MTVQINSPKRENALCRRGTQGSDNGNDLTSTTAGKWQDVDLLSWLAPQLSLYAMLVL